MGCFSAFLQKKTFECLWDVVPENTGQGEIGGKGATETSTFSWWANGVSPCWETQSQDRTGALFWLQSTETNADELNNKKSDLQEKFEVPGIEKEVTESSEG